MRFASSVFHHRYRQDGETILEYRKEDQFLTKTNKQTKKGDLSGVTQRTPWEKDYRKVLYYMAYTIIIIMLPAELCVEVDYLKAYAVIQRRHSLYWYGRLLY